MDQKLREYFGDDMHETGREGGELQFTTFLKASERSQINMFWSTPKGKLIATKSGRNSLTSKSETSIV